MPEVPPVIKIVFERIFMKDSPIIRDNHLGLNLVFAAHHSTAIHMRREETMTRLRCSLIFLFVCFTAPLCAQQPARPTGDSYQLKPSPKTTTWGFYDAKTPPALRIKSGDTVEMQTLITASRERFESAGLWPDRVEPAWREIYEQVKDHGPGIHMLTGLRRRGTARRRPGSPHPEDWPGDSVCAERFFAGARFSA
jgi:hypothetical protein